MKQIVSIFNLTLPNFIISPMPIIFSSFFLDNLHERDKHEISDIFCLNSWLKIGLHILNEDKFDKENSAITKNVLSRFS